MLEGEAETTALDSISIKFVVKRGRNYGQRHRGLSLGRKGAVLVERRPVNAVDFESSEKTECKE